MMKPLKLRLIEFSDSKHSILLKCLITVSVLCASYVAFFLIIGAWYSLVGPIVFLCLIFTAYLLYKKSYLKSASILISLGMLFAPAWCLWFTGGPHSPLFVWQIHGILLAGILVNWFFATILSFVTIINVISLFITDINLEQIDEVKVSTLYMEPMFFSAMSVASACIVIGLFVQFLITELQNKEKKAQEASEAKSKFLANMSHEIRTPLSGVVGLLDLLEQDASTTQKKYVELAKRSAKLLNGIIGDILDFSKIEANKLTLEHLAFKPSNIIRNVVEIIQHSHWYKPHVQIRVITSDIEQLCIYGDPTRFEQIIFNLVSNAFKFTEQGYIEVIAKIEKVNDIDQFRIIISDTGIGIDADALADIFSAFKQADISTTRHYGGTGLGLTICQRLCELMKGNISIVSDKGKGSKFEVLLPIELAEHKESKNPEKEISTDLLASCQVLVVDDNRINRTLAKKWFEPFDALVVTAYNGIDALKKLKTQQFDVVLMDCQMPIMDGYEATQKIRAGESGLANKEIPIIALTANATKEDRNKCIASGMNDYLTKPVDVNSLMQKIASIIKMG